MLWKNRTLQLQVLSLFPSIIKFCMTLQDKQEYEDAAEILRHDLAEAQKHVSHLKSIIVNRNNGHIDQVTQECARLTDKVRSSFVLF